jgi:glutamine synthetase
MTTADSIEAFMAKLEDGGFEYVRFELPDLHGTARAKTVPVSKAENYARRGLNIYGGVLALDTASMVVPGSGLHEERNYADSKLFPDPASLTPVPWREKTARVVCDVTFQDETPIAAAPRQVLALLLNRAAGLGYNVLMGHEFEFYLLDAETKEQFFQGLHIFNVVRNEYLPLVEVLVDQLRAMGIDIITANMTKPWVDKAGSGCHLHLSLWHRETGANVFLDPAGEAGLSPVARSFIAGQLAHAPAMMALANPTANCYHRLKPHTFAPSNVSWGIEDRTALVRVVGAGDETTHIEMRGGGAASNPYLTAAGTLAAGLLGIEQQLELAPEAAGPSENDPVPPKLPQSLAEALVGLEADGAMRGILGEDFVKLFTTVKRFELARFRAHVTDWERDEYLEIH